MFTRCLVKHSFQTNIKQFLPRTTAITRSPDLQWAAPATRIQKQHTDLCPASKGAKKGSSVSSGGRVKRALRSGKVRLGFIPEEWFTFFYVKTGKTGGYIFLLALVNYCVSKEIFVMEHEYYSGLTWVVVIYYITTRYGKKIGAGLDKKVDAIAEDFEFNRNSEKSMLQQFINDSSLAQEQARSQSMLMDAKKENVKMQLEAIYRERCMRVYRTVKGRMDYHIKLYYAMTRVHQKWMTEWVIREVMKGITPEFEQQALNQALNDLERIASKG